MSSRAQFVTDQKGKRIGVLLDVRTYEKLRSANEELADIKAYDKAKPLVMKELSKGQFTSLADYRRKRTLVAK